MHDSIVDRKEDMSPDGHLRLFLQEDGDVIISVAEGGIAGGVKRMANVEFCTLFGGGGSPRTYQALRDLIVAMALDNRDILRQGRKCEFEGPLPNLNRE